MRAIGHAMAGLAAAVWTATTASTAVAGLQPEPKPEAVGIPERSATPPGPIRFSRESVLLNLLAPGRRANPTEVTVDAAQADVRARPRDADAWWQLGESLDVAGRLEEAAQAYEQATRLPPRVIGRAFLYRDLAAAREKIGDLPGALAAARTSVRSWPLSRDGLWCGGQEVILLMRLLVKTGDLEGAAEFYRPLYEAQPERDFCRRIQQALTREE